MEHIIASNARKRFPVSQVTMKDEAPSSLTSDVKMTCQENRGMTEYIFPFTVGLANNKMHCNMLTTNSVTSPERDF